MKIWEKGVSFNARMMDFTIGKDRELDMQIAGSDIVSSIAHALMLEKTGLLSTQEAKALTAALKDIYRELPEGRFFIEEGVEDIHSQLEKKLIERLDETGKKIHTARSRNDQVITAIKLYYREQMSVISTLLEELVELLLQKADQNRDIIIPGYTHLQAAMYSSLGLWFSAWAEAITESLLIWFAAFDYVNMNPLGSAAGYGSSFPIDRDYTAELLAFESLHVNSVNAQLSRGKTEKFMLMAFSAVAGDISKMAMDLVLFLNQNFAFVELDEEFTTGSSIMPHKKNPDILELLRAKANRIQSKQIEVFAVSNNLPSGYHRDMQLLKEISFPVINELKECLDILPSVISGIKPADNILDKEIYKYLGSVELINSFVIDGMSFREAYRKTAAMIQDGSYESSAMQEYTHKGSIGNLALDDIQAKLKKVMSQRDMKFYAGFNDNFIKNLKSRND